MATNCIQVLLLLLLTAPPLSTPAVIRREPVSSAGAFSLSAKDTFIVLNGPNAIPGLNVTRGAGRAGVTPDSSHVDTTARGTTKAAATDREARIINYQSDIYQDGYHFQFETTNGIKHEEAGRIFSGPLPETGVMSTEGRVHWHDPSGVKVIMYWHADENGYQPLGIKMVSKHRQPSSDRLNIDDDFQLLRALREDRLNPPQGADSDKLPEKNKDTTNLSEIAADSESLLKPTADSKNLSKNIAGSKNLLGSPLDYKNLSENTANFEDLSENTSDSVNIFNDTASHKDRPENPVNSENFPENATDFENLPEKIVISKDAAPENSAHSENLPENVAGSENISENTADTENLLQKSADLENLHENTEGSRNVPENITIFKNAEITKHSTASDVSERRVSVDEGRAPADTSPPGKRRLGASKAKEPAELSENVTRPSAIKSSAGRAASSGHQLSDAVLLKLAALTDVSGNSLGKKRKRVVRKVVRLKVIKL